ncbi:MAG: hypothetical protein RLZZ596_1056 [Pseudomonadota bacterium]|jgi:LysR family glycine cleavage system transcriptional activator
MARDLPPLNALRAFEAAARHNNYTVAARDLQVTQSAVSRQISTLEAWLSCKLFERHRQGVQLTPAGKELAAQASHWFDQIAQHVGRLKRPSTPRQLRINLPPTFAIHWLMPRLARFHAQHPQAEVLIKTSHQRTDWQTEPVDISIHSEADEAAPPDAVRLFRETLVPVCAPSLMKGSARVRKPEDLLRHDLLCSTNRPQDWPQWFKAANIDPARLRPGLQFENAALAYQAAANGLGVMIALVPFVEDALREGRLIQPLDLSVDLSRGYYLSHSPLRPLSGLAKSFQQWLMHEAGISP